MLFYITLGAIFFSVFSLSLSFGLPPVLKKNQRSTIGKLSYYENAGQEKRDVAPSFFVRILVPFFARIASFIKRISPSGMAESTKHKLELAGILETVGVDVFLAIKFLFPVAFFFLFILITIFLTAPIILKIVLIFFIPLSYIFPNIYLRSKVQKRQNNIRKSLPNALDLLTISVEAGMGFDTALAKVVDNVGGELGTEFGRMLHEMQIGFSRREAFKNVGRRTDVSELNSFISAMVQADVLGISIGKVLRVQASEMRTKRRQHAEEMGIKAPVKLVFPLIVCLFPALMTVILGPAVIKIMDTLMGMFLR